MPALPIPARFDDILDSTTLAHLATIGPEGSPQTNPIWFLREGDTILFGVKGDTQKLRNIQRNPHIALSFGDLTNQFHYLELRGTVVEITPYHDLGFVNLLARKYTGKDFPPGTEGDLRYRMTFIPTRWTGR